jgi:hypothetical protein
LGGKNPRKPAKRPYSVPAIQNGADRRHLAHRPGWEALAYHAPPGRNVKRTEQLTPVISPVIFVANPGNLQVFEPFSFTAVIWLAC